MQFGNVIYRVLHERSNITASFEEHLKFQERLTFAHALWINSGKSNEKQPELGDYTSWNRYIQGASQTEQYHSSFRRAPKILKF